MHVFMYLCWILEPSFNLYWNYSKNTDSAPDSNYPLWSRPLQNTNRLYQVSVGQCLSVSQPIGPKGSVSMAICSTSLDQQWQLDDWLPPRWWCPQQFFSFFSKEEILLVSQVFVLILFGSSEDWGEDWGFLLCLWCHQQRVMTSAASTVDNFTS